MGVFWAVGAGDFPPIFFYFGNYLDFQLLESKMLFNPSHSWNVTIKYHLLPIIPTEIKLNRAIDSSSGDM